MADGHGGYRAPANPAPVSGPGALSKRTDGGLPHQAISAVPDQDYGEAGQQKAAQQIAPMAGSNPLPNVPAQPDGMIQLPQFNGTPLNAPSQRPNEPVTAGAALGPGPGPSIVPNYAAQPTGTLTRMLQQLSAADGSGVIAQLYQAARNKGV